MIVGANIRDKSSIDLSLFFGNLQLLISRLIAFAAVGLIAGRNPINNLPSRVFELLTHLCHLQPVELYKHRKY